MKLKINDAVAVLDDDLSGTIININGSEITVATTTGFDLVFDSSELVKIKENLMGVSSLFSNTSIDSVLSERNQIKDKIILKYILKSVTSQQWRSTCILINL